MVPALLNEDKLLNLKLALSTVEEIAQLPDPGEDWKERLASLKEASFAKQHEAVLYQMRAKQAELLGFFPATNEEIVAAMMGEPHSEKIVGEHIPYKWVFFHDTAEVSETTNWGCPVHTYIKKSKKGLWFLPPFAPREAWRVEEINQLDMLKKPLPTRVAQGLNWLRKLNLFNAYKAFQSSKDEVILCGVLWDLPPQEDGKRAVKATDSKYFVLAKF